jgi:hypothetical protein
MPRNSRRSRHQPSLSSGALGCLPTRRLPRQAHSHAINSACPREIWTAYYHGACHAKFTLTPSAKPVLWSSGLPRNTAHANTASATPSPLSHHQPSVCSGATVWTAYYRGACHAKFTLTPSVKPVLLSSGLPPNTAPATPSPVSHHQPSLSTGALDRLAHAAPSPLRRHQPSLSSGAPAAFHLFAKAITRR